MSTFIILSALIAISSQGVAASRNLQQAPAPAPAAPSPIDGVLALTAGKVAFVNGTALVLYDIANTTSYIKFPPSPKAGAVSQTYLVSASMADLGGKWAGGPQAALSGSYNGNASTVLVQLDAPKYDSAKNTITFNYSVLPVNGTTLPGVGGTVNGIVSSNNGAEGSGTSVLPYVTPGSTKFYNASLVVDVAGILGYVASPVSAEKAGLIRIPLGWSGFGYWG